MPRWIKQNPDVLLWLVLGQLSPQVHCPGSLHLKISDLEVQMHHHLLAARWGWPHRPHIVGIALDGQVSHTLAQVQGRVVLVFLPDRPPSQL